MSIGTGLAAVVVLDRDRGIGQAQHLGVGQAETGAFGLRCRHVARGVAARALGVDHADFLAAQLAPEHLPVAARQRGLEDVELVRVHRALHHVLAQAVGAGDEDHVAEAGLGVQREDDAAGGAVRAHHLHHAHRLQHLEVVDAAFGAVGDGAVLEEAGEAGAHRVQQARLAGDVEEGLVLAGEAGGGQVFGGGRAAHGQRQRVAVLVLQLRVGAADLGHHLFGQRGAGHDVARQLRAARQVVDVLHVHAVQHLVQAGQGACAFQHVAVGLGGDREAVGNPHAAVAQLAHHFAQRCVLAAHQRHVGQAEF
jgi:hypothetical protein